jgi:hypothetical protein
MLYWPLRAKNWKRQGEEGLEIRGGQNIQPSALPAGSDGESRGMWNAGVAAQANSSRTIKIDRFNLAVMAVHIQRDGTATDLTILNRGKRAGRSVDDRGEDRSAVGANNA